MKLIFPRIYLWIGLLIVLFSIVYETLREPIDFQKGLFSINIGLLLIFFSIKNNEYLSLKKEDIFLGCFLLLSITLIFIPDSINSLLYRDLFITIIITLSIIFYYLLLLFKKR